MPPTFSHGTTLASLAPESFPGPADDDAAAEPFQVDVSHIHNDYDDDENDANRMNRGGATTTTARNVTTRTNAKHVRESNPPATTTNYDDDDDVTMMTNKEEEEEDYDLPTTTTTQMMVSTWEEMNPKRRSTMEDCSVVHLPGAWGAPDPEMAYFGIYDGHGGRDMVEYLEHFLHFHMAQELVHATQDINNTVSMELCMERAFMVADIHAQTQEVGVETSGATVVVCLVKKMPLSNQIIIHTANAGDARAVVGHEGKATRLSFDHRVDDPGETERIEKAGGFLFKGRVIGVLAVTRSLGDHCLKEFVISKPHYNETVVNTTSTTNDTKSNDDTTESRRNATILILACDGLWDVIDDQEAVDIVLSYSGDKTDVAQLLVNEAIRRRTGDNVSVVVVWL